MSEIKEIPMLFQEPMVIALGNETKNMTRRLKGLEQINANPDLYDVVKKRLVFFKKEMRLIFQFRNNKNGDIIEVVCPYGKRNDLIWVRETFGKHIGKHEPVDTYVFKADNFCKDVLQPNAISTEGFTLCEWTDESLAKETTWKPSIHMPKEAARTWLKIVNISCERLQSISEKDAKNEGVERWTEERMKSKPTHYKVYYQDTQQDPAFYSSTAYHSFETLWQKINGPESWDLNPWVWVIEFTKTKKSK